MCNCVLVILLVVVVTTNFRASVKCLSATSILSALICVFSLLAVIVFGVATDTYRPLDLFTGLGYDIFSDRGKWMPRPEYTFLSWSYILQVVTAIFSLVSCNRFIQFVSNLVHFLTFSLYSFRYYSWIRECVYSKGQGSIREAEFEIIG